jgi:hypothetical protein
MGTCVHGLTSIQNSGYLGDYESKLLWREKDPKSQSQEKIQVFHYQGHMDRGSLPFTTLAFNDSGNNVC